VLSTWRRALSKVPFLLPHPVPTHPLTSISLSCPSVSHSPNPSLPWQAVRGHVVRQGVTRETGCDKRRVVRQGSKGVTKEAPIHTCIHVQ
jgi:hypothetical protein